MFEFCSVNGAGSVLIIISVMYVQCNCISHVDVLNYTGQFLCGNKRCESKEGLKSWEVNFAYVEQGEKRNALVKLRKCWRSKAGSPHSVLQSLALTFLITPAWKLQVYTQDPDELLQVCWITVGAKLCRTPALQEPVW